MGLENLNMKNYSNSTNMHTKSSIDFAGSVSTALWIMQESFIFDEKNRKQTHTKLHSTPHKLHSAENVQRLEVITNIPGGP